MEMVTAYNGWLSAPNKRKFNKMKAFLESHGDIVEIDPIDEESLTIGLYGYCSQAQDDEVFDELFDGVESFVERGIVTVVGEEVWQLRYVDGNHTQLFDGIFCFSTVDCEVARKMFEQRGDWLDS